jgi:exonuclease SbcD
MQTLMIAGNHDSGYRIEQVEPLLEKYNAKTVGVIRWNEDKTLNLDRLILPIYDEQKQIVAWCIACHFYVLLKLQVSMIKQPTAKMPLPICTSN